MNIEPRQRNVLIVGTVVGALLGVGAAWLMIQSAGDESKLGGKPVRPGDVFKLTSNLAGVLREVDDIRRRV